MKKSFKFIRYLASIPFAILMLLSIAIFSIFGSIIEQEQSLEFYKNNYTQYFFGFIDYKLIINFGLDHIFKTWWFIGLILLFGSSLTCCTFLQQLPELKSVRRIKFYQPTKIFTSLPINTKQLFQSSGKILITFNPKRYRVFQSLNKMYANKGIVGRISPIIVHFSIVLVLIGIILASATGFIAQELVAESEVFYIQNILNNNIFSFVPHISCRVNDFWILYNENYTVRQFYTDFSLINLNGSELKRETIFVNHPLKYKGLTFYQTDWSIRANRIQYSIDLPYQVPCMRQSNNNFYLTWIPSQILRLQNFVLNYGYTLLEQMLIETNFLYNNNGKEVVAGELNESFFSNSSIKLYDLIAETGIQVKGDPGLVVIYLGFFFLIISIISSYQTYSQIWIWLIYDELRVGGTSNRSKFDFEFEILNLVLQL